MKSVNPTARDLRRINRQTIFQHLYSEGPMSRQELSQRTHLSLGTIGNVISELLAEHLVQEAGFETLEMGRPRAILTLNMDYGLLMGAEIGETEMILELFDLQLNKLQATKYSFQPEENAPTMVADRFAEQVHLLLSQSNVPPEKILGIGIGVPGIVELGEEERIFAPDWGWDAVLLKSMLQQRLAIPLAIDNGSKVMALAELHRYAEDQRETLAVLNLGTGVGAGIIYQGKLYRGGNNSAGEWGHTTIVLDGRACRCGCHGCLEAYIGAPGIISRFREIVPESPLLAHDETTIIKALILSANQGNEVMGQVLSETIHYLGAGIANLINVVNPQRIILGGKIGILLGAYCLPEIIRETRRYALKQPFEAMTIQTSQFGNDAASLGAARLILEDFLNRIGEPNNRFSQHLSLRQG